MFPPFSSLLPSLETKFRPTTTKCTSQGSSCAQTAATVAPSQPVSEQALGPHTSPTESLIRPNKALSPYLPLPWLLILHRQWRQWSSRSALTSAIAHDQTLFLSAMAHNQTIIAHSNKRRATLLPSCLYTSETSSPSPGIADTGHTLPGPEPPSPSPPPP